MRVLFTKAFLILSLGLLLLGSQSGCGRQQAAGSVGMMGGGMPKTEVIVDTVTTDDVPLYMYIRGQMQPYKEVEIRARISGYLEGLFFRSGGIVKEGDRLALIEQDQYEVALDAAKAELEVSMARAQLAKANLDRARALVKTQTISEEEFQSKQAEYEMAVATVELGKASVRKAELDLSYTNIVAPIPGKMTKNLVDIGNYISPGTESAKLLRIAQMDPIYVDFEISDRQFADLKDRMGYRKSFDQAIQNLEKTVRPASYKTPDGQAPEFATTDPQDAGAEEKTAQLLPPLNESFNQTELGRIDVSLTTASDVLTADFPLSGRLVALVDNKITKETGQITLRGEFRNPLLKVNGNEDYLLYPGQICRVRIPYETVKNAVLVHEEAILTDLDTKYVLIVKKEMYTPKNHFGQPLMNPATGEPIPATEEFVVQRRDIKLGRLLDTQQRIVLDGLEKDETYIVKGVQRARIGTPVTTVTLEEFNKRRSGGGIPVPAPEEKQEAIEPDGDSAGNAAENSSKVLETTVVSR